MPWKTIITLLLALGTAGQALAQKRYPVTLSSTPPGAAIYLEDRAAGVMGTTPHTFQLVPGTYTFILEAPDYKPLTRTVTVKGKAAVSLMLEAQPAPAALKVVAPAGSAAEGATVEINGKGVGTVPLELRLQQGRYLVEVIKAGYQTFRRWIDVTGEPLTVDVALERSPEALGQLLVGADIVGAQVLVNRQPADTTPALVSGLEPGKYTVEVRADGYKPAARQVEVVAGQTHKLSVSLEPDNATLEATTGTLQVLTNRKEVQVYVDGEARGLAPVKIRGLAEGSHVVEGRREGFTPAEQNIAVTKGELTTVKLDLPELKPVPRSGAIKVASPVLGAQVFIDGQLAGKTPVLRHQLPPGPHLVAVRGQGYEETVLTVEVKPGEITEVEVKLTQALAEEDGPATTQAAVQEGPLAGDTRALSSLGAQLVPPRFFTADLSLGFPHIFEARFTTGLLARGALAWDGGIAFRTYGALSEIGLHSRLRVLQRGPLALAALLHFGGGGGPLSRSTIYANLGAVGSLWIKGRVNVSARATFNLYSDRLCPGTVEASEVSACLGFDDHSQQELRDRVGGARFLLAALVEVPLSRRINLFGLLEGAPFQGNRLSLTDRFAALMPDSDPAVYFRLGASFKY